MHSYSGKRKDEYACIKKNQKKISSSWSFTCFQIFIHSIVNVAWKIAFSCQFEAIRDYVWYINGICPWYFCATTSWIWNFAHCPFSGWHSAVPNYFGCITRHIFFQLKFISKVNTAVCQIGFIRLPSICSEKALVTFALKHRKSPKQNTGFYPFEPKMRMAGSVFGPDSIARQYSRSLRGI